MADTEIRLTCDNLVRTRELIRSLRDDEQVKPQEPRSASGCVLMTRASGRSVNALQILLHTGSLQTRFHGIAKRAYLHHVLIDVFFFSRISR